MRWGGLGEERRRSPQPDLSRGLGECRRPGGAARWALCAVCDRALPRLRHHAGRQPRPWGLHRPGGLPRCHRGWRQRLETGRLSTASIDIAGQLAIGWYPLIVFVVGVLAIAGLQRLFSRTALGRAFRATAEDQETVRLMGIDN